MLPNAPEIDKTPAITREYWAKQGYSLADVVDDPKYLAERLASLEEERNSQFDPKYLPSDPSHPRAYVPPYVLFKMRRDQNFTCHVLGWGEEQWYIHKETGVVRQVGKLTKDHTLAGANGGLTHQNNLKMVAEIVNSRKGSRFVTYEELRKHFLEYYELFQPTLEMQVAEKAYRAAGVKKVIFE